MYDVQRERLRGGVLFVWTLVFHPTLYVFSNLLIFELDVIDDLEFEVTEPYGHEG
jgi:hypothetical protein